MINQSDQDKQGVRMTSGRLVLPAPPDAGQQRPYFPPSSPLPPANQRTSAASQSLVNRVLTTWRRDPAYAVLSFAIALVVIAAIVFVSLFASSLVSGNSGSAWSSAQTEHPTLPTPAGTVDNKPNFPTPVTGKGSNQSSQPSGHPTPNLPDQPTPPTDQGTLTVQITSIPDVVANGSRVRVGVQTSEPNVSITLQVTYTVAPFFYSNGGHTTNGSGNGAITWSVRVYSLRLAGNAQATVIVTATDQNGQQATSQPVTVTITG
jgi:hypothetical protein